MSDKKPSPQDTGASPGEFLKEIQNKPVVVKLNSGVDYRGAVLSAPVQFGAPRWATARYSSIHCDTRHQSQMICRRTRVHRRLHEYRNGANGRVCRGSAEEQLWRRLHSRKQRSAHQCSERELRSDPLFVAVTAACSPGFSSPCNGHLTHASGSPDSHPNRHQPAVSRDNHVSISHNLQRLLAAGLKQHCKKPCAKAWLCLSRNGSEATAHVRSLSPTKA